MLFIFNLPRIGFVQLHPLGVAYFPTVPELKGCMS